METKNVGIIAAIIVGIALVGVIAITPDNSQRTLDENAVDFDTVDVLLQNKEHVFVVDIRDAEQYNAGHIDGAAHDVLDSATLEKRVNTIQNRLPEIASTYNIVLVDDDGIGAKQAAQTMTAMGINTFYLEGGMDGLSENLDVHSQTVIDSQELSQKLAANEDLYLLDVREPDELLQSKIDGAINIPLAEIFQSSTLDEIPKDKPVVIICGSGNRATIATYAMAQEGIDFQVLEGGMIAWNAYQES
ncbi:rhodanese-like domain-containing protein [Nitrosopumilus sp.]|uniref:rhodanese-like domain-containing protein n=1 Tax=Nitrosopumilus sp. TaxID=2024843 RepID=UPI003D0A9716